MKKLTAKNKSAINYYNKCGDLYAAIKLTTWEPISFIDPDPNKHYLFRDRSKIKDFINIVREFAASFNKLNIYDIPDTILANKQQATGIIKNYKNWRDDVDVLVAVAKRESYLRLIKGNIQLITDKINRALGRNYLDKVSKQKLILVLSSTVLNINAIEQNESTIKSIVSCKISDRSIVDIFKSFDNIKGKISTTEDEISLYESANPIIDSEDDLLKKVEIKSISIPDTTLNQGSIKYDQKNKVIQAVGSFERGDVIEVAPVQILDKNQFDALNNYMPNANIYFEIVKGTLWGLPLGYVPVYMYSSTQDNANAYFRFSPTERVIRIIALRDIAAGDNITVFTKM